MKEQYLDQMELERERGITIKLQPVRMLSKISDSEFILNLIDTPGHVDFSYEVSRALKAVEGAILLVDATQGVQAQTISSLEVAKSMGLKIIPVINKIDSSYARIKETEEEIINILKCDAGEIIKVSAKTGGNVEHLLQEVVRRMPAPAIGRGSLRALVFDFEYSLHRGVILYVRIVDGEVKRGDKVFLYQAGAEFIVSEVGIFTPEPKSVERLRAGEIGYVVTNVKEEKIAQVGDTLLLRNSAMTPLEGYKKPAAVVWASIYPESQDDFVLLKQSLQRLNLSDSALSFEEEGSGVLGKGFRCGFLGMLHLEIIIERLRREFGLRLVTATPTVAYKVAEGTGFKEIYSPAFFPEHADAKNILEPWAEVSIIAPYDKLGDIMQLLKKHKSVVGETEQFGEARVVLRARMPLREMMKNFFERLKSVTAGYASLDYKINEDRPADLVRLDVLLNDEPVQAFSRIVERAEIQREAQKTAERLKEFLPKALFVIKIQVKGAGRILAARSISALKKDVTGYLYGGDRTRKMKLWEKQKKGKEKLKRIGRVNVPHEVFLKMMKE